MRVRRFSAPTLRDALGLAKETLGADALVLTRREADPANGRRAEVVVAIDRELPEDGGDVKKALQRLARKVRSMSDSSYRSPEAPSRREPPAPQPARVVDKAAVAVAASPPPPPQAVATDVTVVASAPAAPIRSGRRRSGSGVRRSAGGYRLELRTPPALTAVRDELERIGLPEVLLHQFSDAATDALGNAECAHSLAAACEAGMQAVLKTQPLERLAPVTLLLGPPGSGKSLSACKLVAGYDDGPVLLARFEIEAHSPERSRGTGHGQPQIVLQEPEQLERLIRRRPDTRIVVDTFGVGRSDRARLNRLFALRSAAPDAQTTVVLPAGLNRDDASAIIGRLQPLRPDGVALTRLDDGGRLGEVLAAVADSGLPLAFTTHGYRVPEDWEPASYRTLAGIALRSLVTES